MENIGARRLHTVLTTLLEEVLFELPDYPSKHIVFDGPAVRERLLRIVRRRGFEEVHPLAPPWPRTYDFGARRAGSRHAVLLCG